MAAEYRHLRFPSLSEALSNALMEAMARGCCPIASKVGGYMELIEDGVCELLFEPGNSADWARKLREMMLNVELWARISSAAHDFVHARFSQAVSAQHMTKIYDELLPGWRC